MSFLEVGECKVCHKSCLWIPMVDGVLAELEVCSEECLAELLPTIETDDTLTEGEE